MKAGLSARRAWGGYHFFLRFRPPASSRVPTPETVAYFGTAPISFLLAPRKFFCEMDLKAAERRAVNTTPALTTIERKDCEALIYAVADSLYCSPLGLPWET